MSKFDVVAWMETNGRPFYANAVARYSRAIALAHIHNRKNSNRRIAALLARIDDIYDRASDRFQDWATD